MLLIVLVENRKIPTDLRDEALKLQTQTDWDDAGGEGSFSVEETLFFLSKLI